MLKNAEKNSEERDSNMLQNYELENKWPHTKLTPADEKLFMYSRQEPQTNTATCCLF